MTGFQCNFKNAASTKTLAAPKVPRRYVAVVMPPVFIFMMFTNYRERIVVAQNRVIISSGIMTIARMVRSSLSTGIRRSATICSRVPIHHRSHPGTCTTSTTERKTTFSKTRPARIRLVLCPRPVLCPGLRPSLHLVRLIWLVPTPRLCLQIKKSRLLRTLRIHRRNPRRTPLQVRMGPRPPGLTVPLTLAPKRMRPSQQQQVAISTTIDLTTTTGTLAPVMWKARTSKSTQTADPCLSSCLALTHTPSLLTLPSVLVDHAPHITLGTTSVTRSVLTNMPCAARGALPTAVPLLTTNTPKARATMRGFFTSSFSFFFIFNCPGLPIDPSYPTMTAPLSACD